MKFFTPDLYRRFNSTDDAEADAADAEWEEAIREYRRTLNGLRDKLPREARALANASLHDAELLASPDNSDVTGASKLFPPFWPKVTQIPLRQGERVTVLTYYLWAHFRETPAEVGWTFATGQVHWLYDELESAGDDPHLFWHRVLLSDGRVLEIPFYNATVLSFPIRPTGAAVVA